MKIPKIKLLAVPETEEAKRVYGYQWNEIASTRNFLGGSPDGVTESHYPICGQCTQTMTFYAQIDSIGEQYDLADCMVIHNYVCFDCFTIKAELRQV